MFPTGPHLGVLFFLIREVANKEFNESALRELVEYSMVRLFWREQYEEWRKGSQQTDH